MRKVSSAPNLSGMLDRHASLGQACKPPHHPHHGFKGSGGPPPAARGERLKTQALLLDLAPPPPPPPATVATSDAEFLYAVASEGFVTATACAPAIEMDEAPALVGSSNEQARARAMDAASCMATPVMSSRTNGEMLQRSAARMGCEADAALRLRYATEVGYAAGPRGVRRHAARKRNLGDADATLLLAGDGPPKGSAATGEGAKRSSPETKRLLAARAMLEDHSNKLHLDDHPDLPAPDASISLEEPDHEWLVGGSGTASLASQMSVDFPAGEPSAAAVPCLDVGVANVIPFGRAGAPRRVPTTK